jgi:hypothetical protein
MTNPDGAFRAARDRAVRLVATKPLTRLERLTDGDDTLRRWTRYLWARRQVEVYGSVAGAARACGLSLGAFQHWHVRPVECDGCGRARSGSGVLCRACTAKARGASTRSRLLEARDRFVVEYGRAPRYSDWVRSRSPAVRGYPAASTVREHFDSWALFLAARPDAESVPCARPPAGA